MKERPIVMTGPSPAQILAGTKTQTRRIANLDKLRVRLPGTVMSDPLPGRQPELAAKPGVYRARIGAAGAVSIQVGDHWLGVKPGEFHFVCPYADGDTHLGDYGNGRKVWTITPRASRLWVRETWSLMDRPRTTCITRGHHETREAAELADLEVVYRASEDYGHRGWRSPRFMPRWASRMSLDVELVRLERLQEITEGDAIAEGVEPASVFHKLYPSKDAAVAEVRSHRVGFSNRWHEMHGRESWNSNPWVWAVSFRLVESEARAA